MRWDEQGEGLFEMISVEEAQNLVKPYLSHPGTPQILADRDYPPFDRVMMDGIALSHTEYERGVREFPITGLCAAGSPALKLDSGCIEVMTGSPLPEGADLVIPYEHLEIKNGLARVMVDIPRKAFESVHQKGSDCREGEVVLEANQPWNGPHVGIAASVGESFKKTSPKVLIISTGDELVDGKPLPHQIRRSNVFALKKSMVQYGLTNIGLDHLPDDPAVVSQHYQDEAPKYDILIYSGGVSKGKFDYLPNVWSDLGVEKIFHGVSQRPGKPLWFGRDPKRETLVIGLPGNPVSSLVCLHRYFLNNRDMSVKLSQEVISKGPLTRFIPVKITFRNGEVWATPLKIKNSGEFIALAGSDGFVELPGDQDSFPEESVLKFFSWRPL